ncbi:response regulator transcription factor [Pedobacter frigiditerrae]|uniref:Response regulator transcription factor n=1 Tax=Pedobacter frigiditerrae TaxID=2530452 RepID=A0A4R0MWU5_9SPHI|nr:response regulator [Pedobacter frigiditerrae]TCC91739.1 response regulator transcription factor [Pedobacter frigiditerrae]
MNILVADDLEIYRLALKLYIHKHWTDAVVYEASTMFEVAEDVFDVEFDLLILDINMPGTELLEDFVSKATNYTKVIIFSDLDKDDKRVENLIKIGADAFLPKSSKRVDIISTFQLVFSERES